MAPLNLAIVLFWALLATSVVMRLSRRGAATFDEHFDATDRRLVGTTAFYLGAPALVLAAQLATTSLARLHGIEGRFETWIYWASFELSHVVPPLQRAVLAATGLLLLATSAVLLLAWTRFFPSRAAINQLRLETARALLIVLFGIQPLASLLSQRGDLWALRDALSALHPQADDAMLLGYGLVGAWAFWRWPRAHRLHALGTPLHDAARRAQRQLARDPNDLEANLTLGATQLASSDPRALETLENAIRRTGGDPRIDLLLGRALLEKGRAKDAASYLLRAGQRLEEEDERPELLLEVTLALGAARIALGDAEGALLTALAARDAAPRDPRTLLIHADALVLGGRSEEARSRLERELASAEGALRDEIRRRLAKLDRT